MELPYQDIQGQEKSPLALDVSEMLFSRVSVLEDINRRWLGGEHGWWLPRLSW